MSKKVNWVYEEGQVIKDEKRNMVIRERLFVKKGEMQPNEKIATKNTKWYKCKCLKCNSDIWMEERNIRGGNGCGACSPTVRKIILGTNTIWDTDRWMCDLGVSEEDAKKHSKGENKYIEVICPYCKTKKIKKIRDIYYEHSISCICSDGKSYSEKFMSCLLKQLNIEFNCQKSFGWSDKKIYDFYIPKLNMIIETHGEQHYRYTGLGRSLEEEQENDRLKKEKALSNGIKYYIIIDCRKSEIDWIKDSILNSELINIFDLSNIDWLECEEFTTTNLIKVACEYKNNNSNLTTGDIGKIMGYCSATIRNWLKKGTKLGWCNYNGKEEQINRGKRDMKKYNPSELKLICIYPNGKTLEPMNQQELAKILGLNRNTLKEIRLSKKPYEPPKNTTENYNSHLIQLKGIQIFTLEDYLKQYSEYNDKN